MNKRHPGESGFEPEIRHLREYRPSLPSVRLDEIQRQVASRRRPRGVPGWQMFVRTRAALMTALTVGVLMSSGGVAIAISGTGSNGTASAAQYGSHGRGTPAGQTPGAKPVTPIQVSEQTPAASSGQLPFTGFAALSLIVIGVSIAGAGIVVRHVVTRPRGASRS